MSTAAIHFKLFSLASRPFAPASLTVKLHSRTPRFTSSYILPVTSGERRPMRSSVATTKTSPCSILASTPAWMLRSGTPSASRSRRWVRGSCRAGQVPDP